MFGRFRFKFGELWTIRQTFLLPNIPAIQYIIVSATYCMHEKFQGRKILQFYKLRHYVRKPFTVKKHALGNMQ